MRFLLDMPLSERTANWLRERRHDCVHARELGLSRSPDTEILERAAREGRILLTMDLDIPAILALTQGHRPGVILFRMRDPRPPLIHERLDLLLQTCKEPQLVSSITVVEDQRIRIRSLPIS